MRIILSVILFSACFSCNTLKNGVFELRENGIIKGVIYRDGNYQIEVSTNDTTIANIRWLSNKKLIIQGIEKNPNEIERLKFLVSHSKIDNDSFNIELKVVENELDYKYQGTLIKTNHKIKDIFQRILDSLNGQSQAY